MKGARPDLERRNQSSQEWVQAMWGKRMSRVGMSPRTRFLEWCAERGSRPSSFMTRIDKRGRRRRSKEAEEHPEIGLSQLTLTHASGQGRIIRPTSMLSQLAPISLLDRSFNSEVPCQSNGRLRLLCSPSTRVSQARSGIPVTGF